MFGLRLRVVSLISESGRSFDGRTDELSICLYSRKMRSVNSCGVTFAALGVTLCVPCQAERVNLRTLLEDTSQYATAPLRWDRREWLYFGGTLAAIAAAHEHDDEVRRHFSGDTLSAFGHKDPNELHDAVPAAAVVVGTWAFATLIDDSSGFREAGSMLEAGGLSLATATICKYAAGRLRPDETLHPDSWREHGNSFPSNHTTVAFAIGTVLAESGGDDYRWIRRILGYGMAGGTAYARLHDNVHWFSDTVAGAAIGIATSHFIMSRRAPAPETSEWSISPQQGALVLTYSTRFNTAD